MRKFTLVMLVVTLAMSASALTIRVDRAAEFDTLPAPLETLPVKETGPTDKTVAVVVGNLDDIFRFVPGGNGDSPPNLPPTVPTHSVRDSGTTVALMGLSFIGLGFFRRRFASQ